MVVYVSRTSIDIDDELVKRAMQIYRLKSKREAVDYALRHLLGNPMSREEILAMHGSGWGGDLAELRAPDTIAEFPPLCERPSPTA